MVKIEGKRVLVTGGAGFIGSNLVDRFLKEKAAEVVVYDNFSTGIKKHLENKPITIIEEDILNSEKLKKATEGIDIISHHAAELEVFTGIENTIHDLKTNIIGTFNVLNAALQNKVKKVIYASSGGVYGQAQSLPETEDHPLMPHWPYGVSKLAGEKYCVQYHLLYGLPTVSFRYGIVYGPREWYGRVLTMFIKRLMEEQPPVIYGDGEQRRDYVFIDDVVEANMLAIKNDDVNGMVFNVGGGRSYSINEVAKTVIKHLGLPDTRPIYDDPNPGEASKHQPYRKRLPGELKDFILDNSLINEVLGFEPRTNFDEGVKKEIEWIRENPGLWDYDPRV